MQHIFVCTLMALERELLRQHTPEGVASILSRPRQYMDLLTFDRYLY